MNKTPTTLIIMDGFGLMSASDSNAVTLANTPVMISTNSAGFRAAPPIRPPSMSG